MLRFGRTLHDFNPISVGDTSDSKSIWFLLMV